MQETEEASDGRKDGGDERQKGARGRRQGDGGKKKTEERREGWIMKGSKKRIRRGMVGREENKEHRRPGL